jgi:hypothetical protein
MMTLSESSAAAKTRNHRRVHFRLYCTEFETDRKFNLPVAGIFADAMLQR